MGHWLRLKLEALRGVNLLAPVHLPIQDAQQLMLISKK